MEPHSPPLLYARCASPLETGPLPRACTLVSSWVQEGSRWGIGCRRRRELPDPRSGRGPHPRDGRRARMPGRLDPSSAAVDLEVDEAAGKATVPRAPDLGGERVRAAGLRPLPGPFLPEHCPSFTTRAHNEDTRFPLLFWTLYSPWTLLLYYFCLIKSSTEAWRHNPLCLSCASSVTLVENAGRRSLDSAVGQHRWRHPLSLAEIRKNRTGRRNDGDSLPATKGVSEFLLLSFTLWLVEAVD